MDELIVVVRIALFMAAGRLASGGWLPDDLAPYVAEYLTDPMMVERVASGVLAAGTLLWYWFSKARRSLRGVFQ